jgi:hypothetical protein
MQVPGVSQPTQPEQLAAVMHWAHVVNAGVPEHVGPVLKMCGASAACTVVVPQQMRAFPVQSLSDMQGLGHVLWQIPLQQSWPLAAQSLEAMHDLGHDSYIGLRHSPAPVTDGSMLLTVVQHTSPRLVWQSVLVAHVFGHAFEGTQTP